MDARGSKRRNFHNAVGRVLHERDRGICEIVSRLLAVGENGEKRFSLYTFAMPSRSALLHYPFQAPRIPDQPVVPQCLAVVE